ncbi:MAG: vWA domain-containing protein, partial [Myxococcota bacterium]
MRGADGVRRGWLWVALLGLTACDGPGGGRGSAGSAGIDTLGEATSGKADMPGDGDEGDTGGDDGGDTSGLDDDDGVDPQKFDVQGPDDPTAPPPEEEEECATVTESAAATVQPADVIFVIDNSGSMTFEANAVQQNMNGFSQQIVDSGVDVNVVMISSYSGNGVCVAPPLGGGGCPGDDNNLPTYRHVGQSIGSNNALSQLVNLHGQWQPSMRAEASKHIVIVTDDNSSMNAAQFDAAFVGLDASYAEYRLHGIVSLTNCPQTAQIGNVYIDLANDTGGVLGDLCDQDF